MEKFLAILLVLGGVFVLYFLGFALSIWLICWAFNFEFLWKYVIGVWLVAVILKTIFSGK